MRLATSGCLALSACQAGAPVTAATPHGGSITAVEPNDNRRPAGTLRDGVLTIELDAVTAAWRPDRNVDTAATVQAFAERGGRPQIPGPLIRVPQGTEVRALVRNLVPDSTLVVTGLTAAAGRDDTVRIAAGDVREIRFRASAPGTYLYLGRTSPPLLRPGAPEGRDSQLRGAIVVDPVGARADPRERIFVITLIDIFPDSARGVSEDLWEVAINGLSWPHTERLRYDVGDTIRWRWINGTDRIHPMHLHGFHFRVLAKGGVFDTTYAPELARLAVTELMPPRSTFRMEWMPTREGNWLMHCHMIPHIVPFPERSPSARAHDVHDASRHTEEAMAGLVLGITTVGRARDDPARMRGGVRHRLLVQESIADSGIVRRGYVLQRDAVPRADSVEIPGSPLIVTRGSTTTVTIVNRLTQPTSVHWHGMELESVFDGVAGFSGMGRQRTPLTAPGDSFTVTFTPPRAGTYMYHTHMDEEEQLTAGLYAPLIVLEPDESYDPATDLIMMVGLMQASGGTHAPALNGRTEPPPVTVTAGVRYRLRLLNLHWAAPMRARMLSGEETLRWRPISKDGAALPAGLARDRSAEIRMGVGETHDFEWTPSAGDDVELVIEVQEPDRMTPLRQRFVINR
jgi:FtsP/CotA-like multicopper oxidase with cupredoxin domain